METLQQTPKNFRKSWDIPENLYSTKLEILKEMAKLVDA